MRGPVWKARRSARLSKEALEDWAKAAGFKLVLLDAASGNPRTGIADASLCRIKPRSPDQIDLYVVQLKGGRSGLKPTEMARLTKAATGVKATPLVILHDGERLYFSCFAAFKREAHAIPSLQQLIRIDIDGDGDVFGEWQFVERFAYEPAQAHDGFTPDQDVKTELAL